MSARRAASPRLPLLASALLLLSGAPGCGRSTPSLPAGAAARRVDPARLYAGYHFNPAPTV